MKPLISGINADPYILVSEAQTGHQSSVMSDIFSKDYNFTLAIKSKDANSEIGPQWLLNSDFGKSGITSYTCNGDHTVASLNDKKECTNYIQKLAKEAVERYDRSKGTPESVSTRVKGDLEIHPLSINHEDTDAAAMYYQKHYSHRDMVDITTDMVEEVRNIAKKGLGKNYVTMGTEDFEKKHGGFDTLFEDMGEDNSFQTDEPYNEMESIREGTFTSLLFHTMFGMIPKQEIVHSMLNVMKDTMPEDKYNEVLQHSDWKVMAPIFKGPRMGEQVKAYWKANC